MLSFLFLIDDYQSLTPTVLFSLLVPRIVSQYHRWLTALTDWENHESQAAYDSSLTLKTFAFNAQIALSPALLTIFVYLPFGQFIAHTLQTRYFGHILKTQLDASTMSMTSGRLAAQLTFAAVASPVG